MELLQYGGLKSLVSYELSFVIHRRSFLEMKGLTKEEIDEAFRRVPDPPLDIPLLKFSSINSTWDLHELSFKKKRESVREVEDCFQVACCFIDSATKVKVGAESPCNEDGEKEDVYQMLRRLADPCVRGTYAYESLRTTVEFAINCLCEDQRKRPSIEDVVWNLQYTIQVQHGWTSSGNLRLGGT